MIKTDLKSLNGIKIFEFRQKVLEMALQTMNTSLSKFPDFAKVNPYIRKNMQQISAGKLTVEEAFHIVFGYFCPNCSAKLIESKKEIELPGGLCKQVKNMLCCESCGYWRYVK